MAQTRLEARLDKARFRSILLAEDEPLIRWGLAEDLRQAGFSVIEVSSADDGLVVLGSGAEIDLVLTDINMPGSVNGLDLARAAHRLQSKVIVMSAVLPVMDRPETWMFDAFLKKPFTTEMMFEAVQSLARGTHQI